MFERGFVILRHSLTIELSRNINHTEGEVRVRTGVGGQQTKLPGQPSLLVQHHLVGDSTVARDSRKLSVVGHTGKREVDVHQPGETQPVAHCSSRVDYANFELHTTNT